MGAVDARKRKSDDEPSEEIDYTKTPDMVGSIQQLTEPTRKQKIKKRPIGFLANIDEFIED